MSYANFIDLLYQLLRLVNGLFTEINLIKIAGVGLTDWFLTFFAFSIFIKILYSIIGAQSGVISSAARASRPRKSNSQE